MVDVHEKLQSIRQMMSDVDGFIRRGHAAFRLVIDIANEIDESLKKDYETGRKMIEYIEQEAMPQIGEWGTVSIGKATVQVIGKMVRQAAEITNKFGIESDNNIVDIAERLNGAATRLAAEKIVLERNLSAAKEVLEAWAKIIYGEADKFCEPAIPDNPERPHIVKGEFQSDKYPKTPRGKVPLSVKDPLAQELLWEYAQRRRQADSQFASDLEFALRKEGFAPQQPRIEWDVKDGERRTSERLFVHHMVGYDTVGYRPFELADMPKVGWYTAPPWLSDAVEALGQKPLTLNWNQVLESIKKVVASNEEKCIIPHAGCSCRGCELRRARAKPFWDAFNEEK
jgi:hypothetical protein